MTKNKNIYPQIEANPDFSKIEEKIIEFWTKNKVFEESVNSRPSSKDGKNNEFIFYDGPPFANGLPHYGHLLTGFIKDTYARYQTIKGKRVERRFGWDCHGLPAEMGAEKELKISGRADITSYGIDKFNAHCEKSVMKYTSEWERYVNRQARWVDFENSYKTMDKNFMESVIWAFSELYKKGLVYQSMRVMPYSWACETPLSNFETRLDNSYRERADKAVTVSFKLKNAGAVIPDLIRNPVKKMDLALPRTSGSRIEPGMISKEPGMTLSDAGATKILAWTTTPWTLPSNLALAVGKDIGYILVRKDDEHLIMAKFAFAKYKTDLKLEDTDIISEFPGSKLEGLEYEPLFDYFKDNENSFKILVGDFVTEGDGTGIVHMAPGFGEDDQMVCQNNGISLVCPVDNSGKFTSEVPDFQGLLVFDANDPIIIKLKQQGSWIKTEQYLHNYPHCWRTDTPLIYKAVPSWYVKVTSFKDRMVELNQQINWIPGHIKDGMFGKWLENARDWSISRNRFWGTPLPIWVSSDLKYPRIDVYGSIAEMEKDFGVEIKGLHRPFIDSLVRPNPDDPTGKSEMHRVEDVFDCWFESGSMPYGQAHYPFENKDWFEKHFPADFIVEYSAQTRGWFYTLMVLSTALFDRPPFLNCICHGVILDSTGQKLSKRLNNFADPMELFGIYGADSFRYTMLSSTVTKGQELLIDKDGKMVHEVLRLYVKPIWNAYNFFTLYANADGIKAELSYESDNVLDKYIIGKLKIALEGIDKALEAYDTQSAYACISDFFEVLNNWYIRRSRSRFWQSEITPDKLSAYNILYTCLENMMRAISPLMPLISEEIYLGLNHGEYELKNSIHLKYFPDYDGLNANENLISTMDIIRDICSSALFIRNTKNVRVRQPLSNIKVILASSSNIPDFIDIIKEEINVKNVEILTNLADYADTKLNINFQVLGKRIPAKMKDIISASKQGNWTKNVDEVTVSGEVLLKDEYEIALVPKGADGAKILESNDGLVILDLTVSHELRLEGYARDIIRFIQQARKDANYIVSDRIKLEIQTKSEIIAQAVNEFAKLIEDQTLSSICYSVQQPSHPELDSGSSYESDEMLWQVQHDENSIASPDYSVEQEIEGEKLKISMKR